MNDDTNNGEIGLATSLDGLHWNYEQIVLYETWHMSYPLVFQYNGEYYMIPETADRGEVRIYRATAFPYSWSYLTTIISGIWLHDSTIFRYNNIWWMFTSDINSIVVCFILTN